MVVQRRGTDTDTDTDTEAREPKSQAAEEILSIFKNQKKSWSAAERRRGQAKGGPRAKATRTWLQGSAEEAWWVGGQLTKILVEDSRRIGAP